MAEEDSRVLLEEIRAEAEAERERILSEGRAQAAAIRERGQEALRKLEAEALRQLERRLAVDRDRLQGESRLRERAGLLAVRREWIDRAFQLAGLRLAEGCASPDYERLLEALMREAVEALGGEGELRVAGQDLELARGLARRRGLPHALRAEGSQPGTVVALSGDRRVENSLATRLAEAARSMEREVAQLLFGKSSGASDG